MAKPKSTIWVGMGSLVVLGAIGAFFALPATSITGQGSGSLSNDKTSKCGVADICKAWVLTETYTARDGKNCVSSKSCDAQGCEEIFDGDICMDSSATLGKSGNKSFSNTQCIDEFDGEIMFDWCALGATVVVLYSMSPDGGSNSYEDASADGDVYYDDCNNLEF